MLTSRRPSRLAPLLALLGALGVASCGVSPQPEPPATPVIDVARVTIASGTGEVTLTGAVGAVTPGAGELSSIDLDAAGPIVRVAVAADGSFVATLPGHPSDWFRLQATRLGVRGVPVDVTTQISIIPPDRLVEIPPPLDDCFSVSPARELADLVPATTATVTLVNRCAADVTVGSLQLRAGAPSFGVTAAAPLVVPIGGTRTFGVTYAPAASGPTEGLLVLGLTAPVVGRRPLSLSGRSP